MGKSDNKNVSKETNNIILGSDKRLKKLNENNLTHIPSFLSSFVPQHFIEDPPGVRDYVRHWEAIGDLHVMSALKETRVEMKKQQRLGWELGWGFGWARSNLGNDLEKTSEDPNYVKALAEGMVLSVCVCMCWWWWEEDLELE